MNGASVSPVAGMSAKWRTAVPPTVREDVINRAGSINIIALARVRATVSAS